MVKVTWLDAEHGGSWASTAELEAKALMPITSYGWIAHEDKDKLVLAASRYLSDNVDMWGQVIVIPLGMIVAREEINAD